VDVARFSYVQIEEPAGDDDHDDDEHVQIGKCLRR